MMWARFKTWIIQLLGGHVEDPNKPKELFFRHPMPSIIPLDRPFDSIDWERLTTLPIREPVFFEWLAHCINEVDRQAEELKSSPDTDRERFGLQRDRRTLLRCFRISQEAAERLVILLRKKEAADRTQKGMSNHGR